jgi:hypothetical protein
VIRYFRLLLQPEVEEDPEVTLLVEVVVLEVVEMEEIQLLLDLGTRHLLAHHKETMDLLVLLLAAIILGVLGAALGLLDQLELLGLVGQVALELRHQ